MSTETRQGKMIVSNRRARFEFAILETMEVGIELRGTEVKSLRGGKGNLQDAYAVIRNGELWLLNAHISPYEQGSSSNHDPLRERKLLMHSNEIRKLSSQVHEKGLTLVPLKMYLKNRIVKVELALAKGKQLHDKRESIKERDVNRSIMRGDE